ISPPVRNAGGLPLIEAESRRLPAAHVDRGLGVVEVGAELELEGDQAVRPGVEDGLRQSLAAAGYRALEDIAGDRRARLLAVGARFDDQARRRNDQLPSRGLEIASLKKRFELALPKYRSNDSSEWYRRQLH